MASDVIRMGRSLTLHASTTALCTSIPLSRSAPENSTIKMLLETTIPVIMITPINDMMLRVE